MTNEPTAYTPTDRAADAFLEAMEADARQLPYVTEYRLGDDALLRVTQDKTWRADKGKGCAFEFRYEYISGAGNRLISRADALTLLREGSLPERESYDDLFRDMARNTRMQAPALITAPCCYCEDRLVFRVGAPDFKVQAWRHEKSGEVYAGRCGCDQTAPHETLYNAVGQVQCSTWRDHHCALPRRS